MVMAKRGIRPELQVEITACLDDIPRLPPQLYHFSILLLFAPIISAKLIVIYSVQQIGFHHLVCLLKSSHRSHYCLNLTQPSRARV